MSPQQICQRQQCRKKNRNNIQYNKNITGQKMLLSSSYAPSTLFSSPAQSGRTMMRSVKPRSASTMIKTVKWIGVAVATIFTIFNIPSANAAKPIGDIQVQVQRHFPCSAKSGPTKDELRIKFPSYKSPGVIFREEKDQSGHKCFRLSGAKVEVYPPGLDGTKAYYVHLETRIGVHNKPERCVNPDKEGCGGIGSCVHCDICRKMDGDLKNFVQIFKKDQPAKCSSEGLPAGIYDDLSLHVCLPSKNEFLPFLDRDTSRAEEIWSIFASSRGASAGEIPLVIAARLFDRPINKLSSKELNDALHGSKKGMVGCHWIYATISQT